MENNNIENEEFNIEDINPNNNLLNKTVSSIQKSLSNFDGSANFKELRKFSKKVVGIYGTSGGIGTTSFIRELSLLFSKNYKVLIIDGNFLFPNQILNYLSSNVKALNLTNLLESNVKEENKSSIFIKSSLSNNINYCNQTSLNLQSYLTLEDEFDTSYYNLLMLIDKYKTLFDIILIDLCPNLLVTGIEQALLKKCDYFIQLYDNNINSMYNKANLEKIIELTSQNNVKTLSILNKALDDKEFLSLPFEPYFNEIYNSSKSFCLSGKSEDNKYIQKIKDIYTIIVKDIY